MSDLVLERNGEPIALEPLPNDPLNTFGAAVAYCANRQRGKASFSLRDTEIGGVKVNAEDVLRFGPYTFRVLMVDGWLVKVARAD